MVPSRNSPHKTTIAFTGPENGPGYLSFHTKRSREKVLGFAAKPAIQSLRGDRKQENLGCLESFLKDGLKNAGFFLSFMAKNGVRSETPRNTVRFPLRFSTE